ncbi:UNVERIFIED_CONTAM: hypothetical protein GTU68_035185 [Idotea baltica]|nr:hypothetical protein [Idotea baltica]
MYLVATSTLL